MIEGEEGQAAPEVQPLLPTVEQPLIARYGIPFVLFAFLSLIVIFLLYQIVGGVATYVLFGLKPEPDTVAGFRVATGAGQLLFILIPTLILVRFASSSPASYLRLRRPDLRALVIPLVGIFSLQQMLQIYLVFQEKIPVPESLRPEIEKFKEMFDEAYKMLVSSHSVPELSVVILVVAVIPAVAEEFLFRGLVQRSIEKGTTPVVGMMLTGIIFGAYHLNPFALVPLVMIGIYLGFLTMRADCLWISMAAHFYNNLFACVATYLNLKDDFVVTGDSAQMSTIALLASFAVFSLIFIASTYLFVKATPPAPHEAGVQPQLS